MNCQYEEIKLPGLIGNYIECIWWETYCNERSDWNQHYVIPDNTIELIFTDADFYRQSVNQASVSSLNSHIVGLKTRPQICVVEESPVISVRFKPKGFYLFSKIKMTETVDAWYRPELCFGAWIKELELLLLEEADQEEKVELIQSFFNRILHQSLHKIDVVFEEIVEFIDRSLGVLPISDLCGQFNVSYKTVERKFVRNLGITPKHYCRLVRTINCLKEGHALDDVALTELTYRYSYFDQSHFIKDVKSLTAYPPRSFYQLNKGIQFISFG